MKVKLSRFLLLLTVLVAVLVTVCSCSKEQTDPSVLISEAQRLLPASAEINTILLGEGIPYREDGSYLGNYREADPAYLEEKGIFSLDDIKEMTRKVYSGDFSEYLISTFLSAVSDGKTVVSYASYMENTDGTLMVYTNRTDFIQGSLRYDLEQIEILEQDGSFVTASVQVYVTNLAGEEQVRQKEFSMIRENDAWYLDSGTYLTFREE